MVLLQRRIRELLDATPLIWRFLDSAPRPLFHLQVTFAEDDGTPSVRRVPPSGPHSSVITIPLRLANVAHVLPLFQSQVHAWRPVYRSRYENEETTKRGKELMFHRDDDEDGDGDDEHSGKLSPRAKRLKDFHTSLCEAAKPAVEFGPTHMREELECLFCAYTTSSVLAQLAKRLGKDWSSIQLTHYPSPAPTPSPQPSDGVKEEEKEHNDEVKIPEVLCNIGVTPRDEAVKEALRRRFNLGSISNGLREKPGGLLQWHVLVRQLEGQMRDLRGMSPRVIDTAVGILNGVGMEAGSALAVDVSIG
jgi:hypothetical protein